MLVSLQSVTGSVATEEQEMSYFGKGLNEIPMI